MEAASFERKFNRLVRPLAPVSLGLLAIAFALGGFSTKSRISFLPKELIQQILTIYLGVIPILFMGALMLAERLRSKEARSRSTQSGKFIYSDAYDLTPADMHGYKIALITGATPCLTGITGDLYKSDDAAICDINSEHIPPVVGCECGFYAFKEKSDAIYQRSIHPGSFLMNVDLFGIGFLYSRGFRAESQRVSSLALPKRCMRCKIFRPKRFVKSYKMGFNSFTHWSWETRCLICSANFKEKDIMSFQEMGQLLETVIV